MARAKTYLLGFGTLLCALGIGYVMQFGTSFGESGPQTEASLAEPELSVTEIVPMSSAVTSDLSTQPLMQSGLIKLAATSINDALDTASPQGDMATELGCESTMRADPAAGAMVALFISASCHGGERVTLHHNGLMFTQVMQPDGTLAVDVPALAEEAMFIAAFGNGDGAVASASVPSLPFYDRVAVQWKGNTGLQLHAREFGADYFTQGHIWQASAGDISRTIKGESGFLTHLGQDTAPDALIAEVYSFPAGTARDHGTISLSVEAEVTQANCMSDVEAQTLELHTGDSLRVRDLTLSMPDCDTAGDFLLLKNLLEDLTIAAN
ncbi:hypothetical protein [Puniceibacterium sp. IMCC21224]|uniref:hypothetical protein n=1 Tax=Puniceibacterium sp. IMCC21224 TaxID=1618204 RepID=UPI00064D7AF1|nr:hypothetical protein [Puniceibacterium sp. IMCC21224]KMK65938.1 hypothetical protein IMCC21224_11781 [Puniceibacterium sp. IMCC21224]